MWVSPSSLIIDPRGKACAYSSLYPHQYPAQSSASSWRQFAAAERVMVWKEGTQVPPPTLPLLALLSQMKPFLTWPCLPVHSSPFTLCFYTSSSELMALTMKSSQNAPCTCRFLCIHPRFRTGGPYCAFCAD